MRVVILAGLFAPEAGEGRNGGVRERALRRGIIVGRRQQQGRVAVPTRVRPPPLIDGHTLGYKFKIFLADCHFLKGSSQLTISPLLIQRSRPTLRGDW